jgi:hypothetical protein
MASDLATFANGAAGSVARGTLNTLITRFQDVINVKDWGATGDGTTNDTAALQAALDYAHGTTGSPHGGSIASGGAGVFLNRPVYFPPGKYIITSALTMRSVRGAHVFGAGRFTTTIQNTSGGNVFTTNGCEYSRFEAMQLLTSSTGVGFDLDWDNTGSTALQSNTFCDMFFEAGAYGCRIGNSSFMGSENLFLNCFFANNTTAGLAVKNGNALQNTVIGGNFQGCTIGIWAASGSIPVIISVGFQQTSTNRDIQIDNSHPDSYFIAGCRSESQYFLHVGNGPGVHVSGCVQTQATAGTFLFYESGNVGSCVLDNCHSVNGIINAFSNGKIWIRGGSFSNAGFIPSNLAGTIMQYDLGPTTVASLPTAGTHLKGLRQLVTNSNATLATGHGNTVAGGGANICPVYCDGSNWKIG